MSFVEGGDHPFTQHDHLLRQLLASRLVEPSTGEGGHGWRLSSSAEQRLRELVTPPPAADKMVFFSHRCARCGEQRPTRRLPDGFVCDPCRGQGRPVAGALAEPGVRGPEATGGLREYSA